MNDPRTPIFEAVRAAGGRFRTQALVEQLHIVLDEVGVPRSDTIPAGPLAHIDKALLNVVCRNIGEEWAVPIRNACMRFEINTIRRIAAFIAQMAHESRCFTRLDENMNYTTAKRIAEVWPTRFTIRTAEAYVRQPQKLANFVYANRMGNGPPESGDGWKFRGGGPLHLTGRKNWQAFADYLNVSLDTAIGYGRTIEGGVMSAAFFWEMNDINRLADTPGVSDESKAINGGSHGLQERKTFFNALVAELLRREQ